MLCCIKSLRKKKESSLALARRVDERFHVLEERLPPEQLGAARDAAAQANLDDLVEQALAAVSVVTPPVRV